MEPTTQSPLTASTAISQGHSTVQLQSSPKYVNWTTAAYSRFVGVGLPRSGSAFSGCHANFHEMATVHQGIRQQESSPCMCELRCDSLLATWSTSQGFGFFRLPRELQQRPHCGTTDSESSPCMSDVDNILE
jgi:hypothetical protein